MATKQIQSIMLQPPRWSAGTFFLALKASPLLLQILLLLSLWPDSLIFVSCEHEIFLQKAFGFFMLAAANFSQAWRFWSRGYFLARHTHSPWLCQTCVTVNSEAGVPAVSSSWKAWALVVPGLFLTNFFSSEVDHLVFLSDLGKVVTNQDNLYLM